LESIVGTFQLLLHRSILLRHPFLRTFLGFDILPLVEFQPDTLILRFEALGFGGWVDGHGSTLENNE
jgi:hypothetical protein